MSITSIHFPWFQKKLFTSNLCYIFICGIIRYRKLWGKWKIFFKIHQKYTLQSRHNFNVRKQERKHSYLIIFLLIIAVNSESFRVPNRIFLFLTNMNLNTHLSGCASVENYVRTCEEHDREWVSHLRLLLGSNPRWTSPPTLLYSIRYGNWVLLFCNYIGPDNSLWSL